MKYSFDNDFISQKVYVVFNMDIHEVFKEYLESRTVDELRVIESKLSEDLDQEYQVLQFDDYSRLVYNNRDVKVFIQYPNDEEEREDDASFEGFYRLIVKYNYEYDCILISDVGREINPKAQAIIDEVYGKQIK